MESRVATDETRATFAEVSFDAERDQKCPQNFSHAHIADRHLWFPIMCRALWGEGATAALFDLVGQHLEHKDERQCRRWARGESEPPQSILWMLIGSKEGWRVVNYIGGPWMAGVQQQFKLAALARDIFDKVGEVVK